VAPAAPYTAGLKAEEVSAWGEYGDVTTGDCMAAAAGVDAKARGDAAAAAVEDDW
jgi:hypothetical protein